MPVSGELICGSEADNAGSQNNDSHYCRRNIKPAPMHPGGATLIGASGLGGILPQGAPSGAPNPTGFTGTRRWDGHRERG
jgi:hypothetical protein